MGQANRRNTAKPPMRRRKYLGASCPNNGGFAYEAIRKITEYHTYKSFPFCKTHYFTIILLHYI